MDGVEKRKGVKLLINQRSYCGENFCATGELALGIHLYTDMAIISPLRSPVSICVQ